MKEYEKTLDTVQSERTKFIPMRKELPSTLLEFSRTYFKEKLGAKTFMPEIRWLFEHVHSVEHLYKMVYPFWSGMFANSLDNFMQSTEHIDGSYELTCAEFGQLKYSLGIHDDSFIELFHIIRFKDQSLSWQQIYQYLDFVQRMKYNVEKAIFTSKQAEDTTVSSDGMKIALKISEEDLSSWLFERVLFFNESKVTWKQIREYLGVTTEAVRFVASYLFTVVQLRKCMPSVRLIVVICPKGGREGNLCGGSS